MACTTYLAAGQGGCIGATGVFGWRAQGASGVAAVARDPNDSTGANAARCAIPKLLSDIQNYLWLDDGSIPLTAIITSLSVFIAECQAGAATDNLGSVNTFDGGSYGGAATVNRLVSGTISPTGTIGDSVPTLVTTVYATNPGTGLAWRREELFNTCFGVNLATQANYNAGVLQSELRVYQMYAQATWSTLALTSISPNVAVTFGP